jgi:DNA replication protein DnaC
VGVLTLPKWDNKLLGSATIYRLRHDAYLVYLDGPSYRKPKSNQALKKGVEKSPKTA